MKKKFRILSIDGGGIRGIIPAQVLLRLEQKLKKKSGDPNIRIGNCFDLIAGTSTGGILACIYLLPDKSDKTRPRFSAKEAVELYFERGDEIFNIPIWHKVKSGNGILDEKYPAEGLERALRDYLGDTKLSDLIKPCMITAYDIKRRAACFFTQHDARRDPSRNFLLREVARATSAAPTYFECANIKSDTNITYPTVDGGVFANNPAMCAYAEARSIKTAGNPTAKEMLILSLGTGAAEKPYYYDDAKDWGQVEWIRPVLDIIMSAVAETVDYQMKKMFDAVEASDQYVRIQTPLDRHSAEMDNAERENLYRLLEIGQELAQQNDKQLERFASKLLG